MDEFAAAFASDLYLFLDTYSEQRDIKAKRISVDSEEWAEYCDCSSGQVIAKRILSTHQEKCYIRRSLLPPEQQP